MEETVPEARKMLEVLTQCREETGSATHVLQFFGKHFGQNGHGFTVHFMARNLGRQIKKKQTCCLVQILPGIVSKDPQGADVSMQMSEFHGGPWATS